MKRIRVLSRLDWVFSFAGLLLLLFLVIPLVVTLLASSPKELASGLSDREVLTSLWITFASAFIATVIALVIGVPLAYLLARREFPGKNLVQGIIDLPIIIPHTAAGVALLMVFGRRGLLGPLGQDRRGWPAQLHRRNAGADVALPAPARMLAAGRAIRLRDVAPQMALELRLRAAIGAQA